MADPSRSPRPLSDLRAVSRWAQTLIPGLIMTERQSLQLRLNRDIMTPTLTGFITAVVMALIVLNDLIHEIIKLFIPTSFVAAVASYYLIKLTFDGLDYINRREKA
jgi:hypothetical protein